MKAVLALMFLVIGLSVWPPGYQAKVYAADRVCFVIDQPAAPVCAVMAPEQEKGGGYIVQCYNAIDVKAVLTESQGELKVNEYAMISPPKSANLNKVYAKHLRKVSHPPLDNKIGCERNKVSVDMVRIRADTSIG